MVFWWRFLFRKTPRFSWWLNGDLMEISWTSHGIWPFFHRQLSRNGYHGDVKLPGGNMSAVYPSSSLEIHPAKWYILSDAKGTSVFGGHMLNEDENATWRFSWRKFRWWSKKPDLILTIRRVVVNLGKVRCIVAFATKNWVSMISWKGQTFEKVTDWYSHPLTQRGCSIFTLDHPQLSLKCILMYCSNRFQTENAIAKNEQKKVTRAEKKSKKVQLKRDGLESTKK